MEFFLQVQKFDWIVTKSFGKDLRSGISPIRSRRNMERRTMIRHWERRDSGRPENRSKNVSKDGEVSQSESFG